MKIGNKIVRLASVDSTNNYIANLVKEREITSGTVVLADEQFLGKGQRGSEWTTNAGENLTFSFFLDNVNLSVENQFILTQLVSLSLIELLDKLNVKAKIKWPNDIYIDSTKVAGVLIENQLSFGQIKSSVIGIGLNVNQKKFDGFNATSLFLENEVHHSLMDILLSFIDSFNKVASQYSLNLTSKIKEEYLKNLYLFEQEAFFEDDNGRFTGRIFDVLPSGKILIAVNGFDREYDLKEIRFL